MEKNKKINKENKTPMIKPQKLKYLMSIFLVIFIALMIRIIWLQTVDGASLKEQAYQQLMSNRVISPKRGSIYDSTGKALAISADVDTVSINPGRIVVTDNNGDINEEKTTQLKEKVAKAFSEIFELDYEETLEKVNSDSSVVKIAKKVEQDKIDKLEEWMKENKIYSGINIDADTKRYYPYNNLASNLIGVCGDDNQGLSGLEIKWESVLKGTSGKIITAKDASQEVIPDKNQKYIPAQNGSDLVLSIDVNIQSILEKYLKQAVQENDCKRGGTAMIMNPQTGDILGMATYPDFNLNDPFTVTEGFSSVYEMWKNKNIAEAYEPGSTFKLITASIALEENITQTDVEKDFYCDGYEEVAGESLSCWRYYRPHRHQTLRKALENSCNPAFMQLGKRIGKETLYQYYDAFGLFNKTGIDLSGEGSSTFWDLDDVGPVEVATMSFGQRFKITPIQLLCAVSAIANDGVLMQPKVVKQIINPDDGTVTNIEPTQVRQVISKETSEKMKSLMESVVLYGTGGNAAVTGYSIGGKTGTSEPDPNHKEEGYTASYIAISPVENAQIALLVALYNPKGENGHQGGQVAGPVVSQMLSEILPYLGIASDDLSTQEHDNSNSDKIVYVPEVTNMTVTEATKKLESLGLKVSIHTSGDKNSLIVSDQMPKKGTALLKNGIVKLYSEENDVRVTVKVPNLKGMSAAQARNSLSSKNLNIHVEGSGVVISQDPAVDTSVEEGTVVNVTLKKELQDAH